MESSSIQCICGLYLCIAIAVDLIALSIAVYFDCFSATAAAKHDRLGPKRRIAVQLVTPVRDVEWSSLLSHE